eukprot:gb/GECG01002053.1/.p1 GENE.gb/GECG01002053.1/~~gb/GECG01002053.1/.p1  ORF type:complete len:226 (+),score=45.84 gb/GECG01002053.1/:1-678(+)
MESLPEDQQDELEALQAVYQPHELTISGVDEEKQHYSNPEEKCVKVVVRVVPFEEQDLETENQRAAEFTVEWHPDYPNSLPKMTITGSHDAFPIDKEIASQAVDHLRQCGEEFLGMSMTSTLVEMLRENLENWGIPSPMERKDKKPVVSLWEEAQSRGGTVEGKAASSEAPKLDQDLHSAGTTAEKMTKNQKRKYHDKFGANKGEYRGWNWVDVLSHLRKTGNSN